MHEQFYISDREAVSDAANLIEEYGSLAGKEAAARAGKSREKGNVVHFCRWRQIKRLVEWMDSGGVASSLH
ncbi:hypothetical protein [Parasphingopyxis lamellibrachiae]|uniref:Uncharacterized protein n=1 Tax=Parasphingopyxis lamellibrachiae TaxID=680125 RepID=A0A3D9FEX9_9SPHN|nr:hypothetical protein [Parasphingopyxis lamellibrachiae]RED16122.1 hypothetical protein DFR46_1136 [Parasphingopyxis lamellibrachiae]